MQRSDAESLLLELHWKERKDLYSEDLQSVIQVGEQELAKSKSAKLAQDEVQVSIAGNVLGSIVSDFDLGHD